MAFIFSDERCLENRRSAVSVTVLLRWLPSWGSRAFVEPIRLCCLFLIISKADQILWLQETKARTCPEHIDTLSDELLCILKRWKQAPSQHGLYFHAPIHEQHIGTVLQPAAFNNFPWLLRTICA